MPDIFLSLALRVARLSLLLPKWLLIVVDTSPLMEGSLCRLLNDNSGSLYESERSHAVRAKYQVG